MKFIYFFVMMLLPFSAFAVELDEQKSVELFLKNNLDVLAIKSEIEISKAQELSAGLLKNPSLFIDSQLNPFGSNWNQKTAGGPTQQDLILTIPVDINGKRSQAVKVAKLATKVSEALFQETVRSRLFILISSLYSLQRVNKEIELLLEKEDLLEKSVLTLQKRVGSSQPLIQNRARLALEEVTLTVLNKKAEKSALENEIRTYLMLSNLEPIKLHLKFQSDVTLTESAKELAEKAQKNRPDFVGLRILNDQLEADLELQHKRILDNLQVQAGITRQQNVGARPDIVASTSLPGAWSWIVGLSIPIPVFDRNQGNIMSSKVRQNQLRLREKYLVQAVENEIDTSLKKMMIIRTNLKSFRGRHLESAQIVRDSALRQFGTGSTTLIEYLDAVDAYHTAINNYITTQYDYTVEYLNLRLISGDSI